MTKKVALCGTHFDTLAEAPFNDPEWEIWTMAHRLGHKNFPRVDVGFEIHVEKHMTDFDNYSKFLKDPTIPVYIRPDLVSKYPKCKAFPMQKAQKLMGKEYFASTFSYMMTKAILDGAAEIGLYGINLTADEEYFYQRPNMEYLIGLAQGKGIKITIPKKSALLSLGYTYGDGTLVGAENPLIAQYQERSNKYEAEIKRLNYEYDKVTEDFKKEVNQVLGAHHECIEIIKALKNTDRGGLKDNDENTGL